MTGQIIIVSSVVVIGIDRGTNGSDDRKLVGLLRKLW
jgi:hypothetical protein